MSNMLLKLLVKDKSLYSRKVQKLERMANETFKEKEMRLQWMRQTGS